MQAIARRTLWSACRFPARKVAGRRYPSRARSFHNSSKLSRPSDGPNSPSNSPGSALDHDARNERGTSAPKSQEADTKPGVAEDDSTAAVADKLQKAKDGPNFYGSALNRSMRNRKPKQVDPIRIPDWFLHRHIRLQEELQEAHSKDSSYDPFTYVIRSKATREPFVSLPLGTSGLKHLISSYTQEASNSGGASIAGSATNVSGPERELLEKLISSINKRLGILEKEIGGRDARSKEFMTEGGDPEGKAEKDTNRRTPPETSDLPMYVLAEFQAAIAAGFATARPELGRILAAGKTNVSLFCPSNGGIKALDAIVQRTASTLGADVLQLNAQILTRLIEDCYPAGSDPAIRSFRNLSYETYQARSEAQELEQGVEEAEEDEQDDEAEDVSTASFPARETPRGKSRNARAQAFAGRSLTDLFSNMKNMMPLIKVVSLEPEGTDSLGQGQYPEQRYQSQSANALQPGEIELLTLLEALLDTDAAKRSSALEQRVTENSSAPAGEGAHNASNTTASPSFGEPEPAPKVVPQPVSSEALSDEIDFPSLNDGDSGVIHSIRFNPTAVGARQVHSAPSQRRLIVHIQDFKELNATRHGSQVVQRLLQVVRERRRGGQQVMVVGTTSAEHLLPDSSAATALKGLQSDFSERLFRTIVVPLGADRASPDEPKASKNPTLDSEESLDPWERAEQERTQEINIGNIQDMIRRLCPAGSPLTDSAQPLRIPAYLDASQSPLKKRILSFDEVHRIVITALGLRIVHTDSSELEPIHLALAMTVLSRSDAIKSAWLTTKMSLDDDPKGAVYKDPTTPKQSKSSKAAADRLDAIRRSATKYEKRLLSGVINPSSISTTFSTVHAPATTIEALKSLTSLSLIRPDAFKYGVLATDKIPGLLLYGPPGTGKTLLAKAVAKESGATVLEVAGAEVYDMYVGEGEKNVRAIFSLARKLSPCVVFIDEADAIFGSRGGPGNRTSHREIINQFLKEWDGMNDLSVFIMVATNRPFDLDDAVLRRLPRRLLVDLPVEKDREAILKIHLKDEVVDGDVDVGELARQTPLYSGSDLKNLAVAAALACVREEMETVAGASLEAEEIDGKKYPEKRTLMKRHFDKALQEISASISEDMGSLSAIRKFDEQFGDRKGRRKKGGWGFGTGMEDRREEAARVRV
ncbi:hypothetical protein W97_03818 [Coniosporium apollinis CBS 100218]|uniref:AAA+ ATPase domain-containing protein n=1 Tax=Coniosporium apollinis (strain CBS 100218) TaxID=1168221 RepID=R7YRS5_CONA1|nr:uncharacterized protein W97_03818 [Coniosporium apollinis CBS 100218]EON64585.1 hypothetical protein W97_03818 [Coniosporium apollinis CBS 100218]